MHLNLEKKVVLVTGGTKGIGRRIVEAFLREGAIVHFCARTGADVSATVNALADEWPDNIGGGTVVDISDRKALNDWVARAADISGRIDVVVANVSALGTEENVEDWDKAYQTDMMGTWILVQSALPHLEKSKGNIITISSVSGRDVDFTAPGPYGAFKAALIHYTSQLAHSLAPKGIRANTVSPGNIYIEDGVWGSIERRMPDLFKSQFEKNPMGRMGKPEEVADAVLFLASERASFISGANLNVDGALCTGVQF